MTDPTGTHGSDPTEAPSSTATGPRPPSADRHAHVDADRDAHRDADHDAHLDAHRSPPPTQTPKVRVHQVLRYYNDVLAEHLDPDRDHLQPYDRKVDSKETTTPRRPAVRPRLDLPLGGRPLAVRPPGQRRQRLGPGRLGLRRVLRRLGLPPRDPTGDPAVRRREVATHDGVRQVAVEHADGQVVVVTADPTYDPRSRSAADVTSTEADLVAAASDDRLILPGRRAGRAAHDRRRHVRRRRAWPRW